MRKTTFLTILVVLAGLLSSEISAQMPTVKLDPYLSGLTSPVYLTNAKDGTNRIFVVERGGVIKVVQSGSVTPAVFLDISTKVGSTAGERGLLGLAFHPQFAANGYFFVNYTRASDGATIIARYKTTDTTNALGNVSSERILLTIQQPFNNHNGGTIEFRSDNGANNLYIGMGDGGSGDDPQNNAQNINVLLGKFLRITPDVSGNDANPAYTIPADNPYVGVAGADEIYAIGMRNPYRWSFDRGGTGQLWAGDVGQGIREEVDIITNGGNFGWRILEGTQCTPGVNPNCNPPVGAIPPVFEYGHSGGRCSITGGYVYRGSLGTVANGGYIYGDYCTGEILIWNGSQQSLLLDTTNFNLVSFGEDEAGEIYVVKLNGTVERLLPLVTTAASVTISGRALTANGRGIANTIVKLTDGEGNIRTAKTSAFGYYHFKDVAAGQTYIISAASKRYSFNQPSQGLSLNNNVEGLNFIANY